MHSLPVFPLRDFDSQLTGVSFADVPSREKKTYPAIGMSSQGLRSFLLELGAEVGHGAFRASNQILGDASTWVGEYFLSREGRIFDPATGMYFEGIDYATLTKASALASDLRNNGVAEIPGTKLGIRKNAYAFAAGTLIVPSGSSGGLLLGTTSGGVFPQSTTDLAIQIGMKALAQYPESLISPRMALVTALAETYRPR